jgi:hypothetical protein
MYQTMRSPLAPRARIDENEGGRGAPLRSRAPGCTRGLVRVVCWGALRRELDSVHVFMLESALER